METIDRFSGVYRFVLGVNDKMHKGFNSFLGYTFPDMQSFFNNALELANLFTRAALMEKCIVMVKDGVIETIDYDIRDSFEENSGGHLISLHIPIVSYEAFLDFMAMHGETSEPRNAWRIMIGFMDYRIRRSQGWKPHVSYNGILTPIQPN